MNSAQQAQRWGLRGRQPADFVLFGITAVELAILCKLTPTFTLTDWIYVCSNLVVLVLALARRPAQKQDRSVAAAIAVVVSYTYTYAQVAVLRWRAGYPASPTVGLVLVITGACVSLTSLISLGRFFGVRPALRGLATHGTYRLIRHPLYLAYIIADIGYNLQEWSWATILLVAAGWASMIYRIHAEEKLLSQDANWATYASRVRFRLIPAIW